MPTVRYTDGGTYRYDGVSFEHGDTADVDAETADYLTSTGDFEEVIDVGGGVVDDADEGETPHAAPFDPAELPVADLKDRLDGGDFTPGELRALGDAEEAGKNRTTALDAIDAALGAVA